MSKEPKVQEEPESKPVLDKLNAERRPGYRVFADKNAYKCLQRILSVGIAFGMDRLTRQELDTKLLEEMTKLYELAPEEGLALTSVASHNVSVYLSRIHDLAQRVQYAGNLARKNVEAKNGRSKTKGR